MKTIRGLAELAGERLVKDSGKTIGQLLSEIEQLRLRLAELEKTESRLRSTEADLRRQSQRTELINSLLVMLHGCQSEEEMYGPLLESALSLGSCEAGALLISRGEKSAVAIHQSGLNPECLAAVGDGLLLLKAMPVFSNSSRPVRLEEVYPETAGVLREGGLNHALLVPMQSGRQFVGVLLVASRRQEPPDRQASIVLSSMTHMATDVIQRRRIEADLALSEARNRAIFEATPDIMFCNNRAGDYTDYRLSKSNPLYVPPEVILGKNGMEVLPASLRTPVMETIGRALDSGEMQTLEYQMDTQVGPRHFEARVVKLNDDEALTVVHDVTERMRAAVSRQVVYEIAEATNMEDDLLSLCESIRRCLGRVICVDNFHLTLYDDLRREFFVLYDTDRYDHAIRFDSAELGRGLAAYVWRTNKPLLVDREVLYDMIQRGEVELVGTPCESWLGVPLITRHRKIGVLVVQSYDPAVIFTEEHLDVMTFVSGQIAAAVQRRREQGELQRVTAALEATAGAIVITDPDGLIHYVNPEFKETTGYARHEILGRRLSDIDNPTDPHQSFESIWATVNKGGLWAGRMSTLCRNGSVLENDVSLSPVRDASGRITSVVQHRRRPAL